jgi:hypothetical protein
MSGKARGKQPRDKQPRDTAAKDALLQLQALHHSHREATRLFLMAVREGSTDAQIAHALRQGLPHLTAPASLRDRHAGKESEGAGTSEESEQPAAQTKRTRTTSPAPTTQPALLAADYFAAALGALPPDDWRTSKRVKEVVDKMRLPAVVRLSRSFWDAARNGTGKDKRQFVLRQLTFMTARPHHHTRTAQMCNDRTTCRVACRRSAGAVPSAGAP